MGKDASNGYICMYLPQRQKQYLNSLSVTKLGQGRSHRETGGGGGMGAFAPTSLSTPNSFKVKAGNII